MSETLPEIVLLIHVDDQWHLKVERTKYSVRYFSEFSEMAKQEDAEGFLLEFGYSDAPCGVLCEPSTENGDVSRKAAQFLGLMASLSRFLESSLLVYILPEEGSKVGFMGQALKIMEPARIVSDVLSGEPTSKQDVANYIALIVNDAQRRLLRKEVLP